MEYSSPITHPLRIEFPGAVYHVTSRGNARTDIFKDDRDCELFLRVLGQVVRRDNWLCHAYCLMGNHYHLLIETPEGKLSAGMRQLNGVFTKAFNCAYGRNGHVFRGRFKAVLVEKESHLLELCRFVVLSPVRAGMVKRPDDFPWSSYLATLGQAAPPSCLTTDWLLANFGTALPQSRRHYRQFVTEGMTQEGSPWAQLPGQVLRGSAKFVQLAGERLDGREAIPEIPQEQRHVGHPALVDLFPPGAVIPKPERDRLIRLAHDRHGYSMTEIAQVLDLHYTTVNKIINHDENRYFKL